MSDFIPIPGWPGYSIDARGRVESERSGLVLAVDKWGRVSLRQGKKDTKAYIGELVLSAFGGAASSPCPAPDIPPPAPQDDTAKKKLRIVEKDLKDARASLDKARRVNAHLIAQVNNMRVELENAENATPKLGRPAREGATPPLYGKTCQIIRFPKK